MAPEVSGADTVGDGPEVLIGEFPCRRPNHRNAVLRRGGAHYGHTFESSNVSHLNVRALPRPPKGRWKTPYRVTFPQRLTTAQPTTTEPAADSDVKGDEAHADGLCEV